MAKIKDTIKKFIQGKKGFTANDIFADLVRRDRSVKKESVVTSVLKQMKREFAHVKMTERPGLGPRKVKHYKPA